MFWILVGIALRDEFFADERRRSLPAIGLPPSHSFSATTLITVALKNRFTIRSSRHFRGIAKACRENLVDGFALAEALCGLTLSNQKSKQWPAQPFISTRFC